LVAEKLGGLPADLLPASLESNGGVQARQRRPLSNGRGTEKEHATDTHQAEKGFTYLHILSFRYEVNRKELNICYSIWNSGTQSGAEFPDFSSS
jgi:hypothetical protein